MTQSEKLEALVQKAIDNGYLKDRSPVIKKIPGWPVTVIHMSNEDIPVERVMLYNHDFARALLGEKFVCARDGNEVDQAEAADTPWRVSCDYESGDYSFAVEAFEFHLQQAVISDNPLDYIYSVVFPSR